MISHAAAAETSISCLANGYSLHCPFHLSLHSLMGAQHCSTSRHEHITVASCARLFCMTTGCIASLDGVISACRNGRNTMLKDTTKSDSCDLVCFFARHTWHEGVDVPRICAARH